MREPLRYLRLLNYLATVRLVTIGINNPFIVDISALEQWGIQKGDFISMLETLTKEPRRTLHEKKASEEWENIGIIQKFNLNWRKKIATIYYGERKILEKYKDIIIKRQPISKKEIIKNNLELNYEQIFEECHIKDIKSNEIMKNFFNPQTYHKNT